MNTEEKMYLLELMFQQNRDIESAKSTNSIIKRLEEENKRLRTHKVVFDVF